MEPLPQESTQNSWDTVSAKSSKKTPITIAGIVLLVLLLAGGVYLYRSGYTLEIGKLRLGNNSVPATIPTPTPIPIVSSTINNCQMTKESDKLVEMVGRVDNKTVGIFKGHIQEISLEGGNITINLISDLGDQRHLFKFPDRPELFYDTKLLKYIKASELKTGDNLFMSFECDPSATNKSPQFTRIAVTGSLN